MGDETGKKNNSEELDDVGDGRETQIISPRPKTIGISNAYYLRLHMPNASFLQKCFEIVKNILYLIVFCYYRLI